MKLNPEQIQHLYQFTQQHYVEYYDLQSELVDHLANGIEQQWENNPSQTFEDALQIEFKKYGVFGFTDLVTERQKAMGKTYYKLILKLMGEYFTVPKVSLTILIMLICYMVLKKLPYPVYTVSGCLFFMIFFVPVQTIKWRRKVALRKVNKERIWMYEDIVYSCGASLGVFQLFIQLPIYTMPPHRLERILSNDMGLIFISMSITLLGLTVYVLVNKIPKKAKEYIAKVHPEHQIV